MVWLSDNPMWEDFGTRALFYAGYGGADFGECLTTVEKVGEAGSVDDWYREWMATADRVAAIGGECARAGHAVSAREAFFRASTYYRTAYYPLYGAPVDPRLSAAFERETASFQCAATLAESPIEVLEIPFGGANLPGYFICADDSGAPRKTVIHVNGYDSTIQESYFAIAPAATRRGYHCLLFDGPGQGRNLIRDGLHMRPDWENVVRPVVDYALTRPEIAPDKIVLGGWSFGGLLAPRAAAFEHRIAALFADPGQWDQRGPILAALDLSPADKAKFPDVDRELLRPLEEWLAGPKAEPMLRWRLLQRGLWVHGKETLFDYFADMMRYEISPFADRIACPVLLTMPEGDPIAQGAATLYEALAVPEKKLLRYDALAGGHCEVAARRLFHQQLFDWLDEILG